MQFTTECKADCGKEVSSIHLMMCATCWGKVSRPIQTAVNQGWKNYLIELQKAQNYEVIMGQKKVWAGHCATAIEQVNPKSKYLARYKEIMNVGTEYSSK